MRNNKGFSLLEMMVSLAVVGVVISSSMTSDGVSSSFSSDFNESTVQRSEYKIFLEKLEGSLKKTSSVDFESTTSIWTSVTKIDATGVQEIFTKFTVDNDCYRNRSDQPIPCVVVIKDNDIDFSSPLSTQKFRSIANITFYHSNGAGLLSGCEAIFPDLRSSDIYNQLCFTISTRDALGERNNRDENIEKTIDRSFMTFAGSRPIVGDGSFSSGEDDPYTITVPNIVNFVDNTLALAPGNGRPTVVIVADGGSFDPANYDNQTYSDSTTTLINGGDGEGGREP